MWDWNVVGEIALGVGAGLSVGGYVVVSLLRGFAYEVLSHPSVRKIASAAEKLSGKSGGLLERGLGMLLGGGRD